MKNNLIANLRTKYYTRSKLLNGTLGYVAGLYIVPFRDMETSKNITLY